MQRRVTLWSLNHGVSSGCLVAAVVLLSGLATSPAGAQLGKLRKIGADAIKDKAKDKAGIKDPEKAPPGSTAARIDYAITDERLTAIVSYLEPLVAEAEQQSQRRAAIKDYNAKQKAANDCFNKISESGAMPDIAAASSSRAEALTAKSSKLQTQQIAATNAKNYRAVVAYADSAQAIQMQLSALMFAGAKCPAWPYKPATMLASEAEMMERAASGVASSESESDRGIVPANLRAGMTAGQFGRIRERMAIWLLVQSGDLPATTEKFTEDELALMTAKSAELKRFGPLFKGGAMRWATWDDITAW